MSWASRKHKSVALSITELMWLHKLVFEPFDKVLNLTNLYCKEPWEALRETGVP
jgi:hypothetical protein